MNRDAVRPRFDLPLFRRRRELRSELRDADWSIGAGFALALLLMTWLGRSAMLVIALRSGMLRGFGARHWLWLASELAHDLWVATAVALSVGGLMRVLPRRFKALGLV